MRTVRLRSPVVYSEICPTAIMSPTDHAATLREVWVGLLSPFIINALGITFH